MDATECGYKRRQIARSVSTSETSLCFSGRIQSIPGAVPNPIERGPRWVPPPGNCFKLNFDAVIFQELQASRFGAIIRNGSGEVMASISARGPPVIDSEDAEILACRKALEFAVNAEFRDLIVEGDNKVVMTSITNTHTTSSRLGHLYGDINCIAAGIGNLTVRYAFEQPIQWLMR